MLGEIAVFWGLPFNAKKMKSYKINSAFILTLIIFNCLFFSINITLADTDSYDDCVQECTKDGYKPSCYTDCGRYLSEDEMSPNSNSGAGLSTVQSGLSQTAGDTGLKTSSDLPTIIGRFVNYMFSVVGIIFMTITLVGGYLWMTAGGNEEKIGKAKGFIVNGINGMIVIFLSYALVYTMLAALKAATTG